MTQPIKKMRFEKIRFSNQYRVWDGITVAGFVWKAGQRWKCEAVLGQYPGATSVEFPQDFPTRQAAGVFVADHHGQTDNQSRKGTP